MSSILRRGQDRWAVLMIPDDLPLRETLNLSIGSPVSRDMIEITSDLFGSLVESGR